MTTLLGEYLSAEAMSILSVRAMVILPPLNLSAVDVLAARNHQIVDIAKCHAQNACFCRKEFCIVIVPRTTLS
jgi:hypothetical protein